MLAWYLLYDQLPNLAPSSVNSPYSYLDQLVANVDFLPDDPDQNPGDRYSFLITQQQEDELINAGFVGFGFSFRIVNDVEVQLAQVFGEYDTETLKTPASEAGLRRGYQILAIEGISVADIIATDPADPLGAISEALGPRQVGVSRLVAYGDASGNPLAEVTIVKEDLSFNTVAFFEVLDLGGRPVGYVNFRSFASPSPAELTSAFAAFNASGARDLVVDLRYNGGGLVSVAEFLANLLAGIPADGQVSFAEVYNDKQSNRNQSFDFQPETESVPALDNVVFITTPSTASASELVINAMLPYTADGTIGSVATVGSVSFGKPVGSLGFPVCGDLILRPVTFQTVNAAGASDYFDGFVPDCPADDELARAFGDPLEDSLSTALTFIETGACPIVAAAKVRELSAKAAARREVLRREGLPAVLFDYH
jgi:C-terminal processing protease CtpA/Prc